MAFESYVSRKFLEDCSKPQELGVFNALYSILDYNISDISQETFRESLDGVEGSFVGPVITFIKDDALTVKIRDDNIRNYSIIYFTYAKRLQNGEWDSGKNLAFAIKVADPNSTELENFTDNYITFDLKSFDLSCVFLTLDKTTGQKYSALHDHLTSSIESNDNNPLIDIIDLNKKVFEKLNTTIELNDPIDLRSLNANRLIIQPNSKVTKEDGSFALNVSSEDFINNDVNLAIVNDSAITDDDILF